LHLQMIMLKLNALLWQSFQNVHFWPYGKDLGQSSFYERIPSQSWRNPESHSYLTPQGFSPFYFILFFLCGTIRTTPPTQHAGGWRLPAGRASNWGDPDPSTSSCGFQLPRIKPQILQPWFEI
jgi:hypothetical protein